MFSKPEEITQAPFLNSDSWMCIHADEAERQKSEVVLREPV